MSHIRRTVYLVHRWVGVLFGVLFLAWFVSGVVMMYVGHPKLTAAERLLHLAPLPASDANHWIGPDQAVSAAALAGPSQEVSLSLSRQAQPVYRITPAAGDSSRKKGESRPADVMIDARTAALLKETGPEQAMVSAAAFLPQVTLSYQGLVSEDAHTHSKALDPHRPMHLVHADDAAGTWLYVSSRTGEVVRDAPRVERGWNYAGSWLHWLYMFRGNAADPYWSDIVIWLSIIGLLLLVLGVVVGVWRWRFSGHYKNGTRSPYASGWMRWHHIGGLLFALTCGTWLFSGLMSMNPWGMLNSPGPGLRLRALQGGALDLRRAAPLPVLLAHANGAVREVVWTRRLGRTVAVVLNAQGSSQVLDAVTGEPVHWSEADLVQGATRLSTAPIARTDWLAQQDFYYYSREPHTMSGGSERPLPVLRVVFDDPVSSWAYLDPATGNVVMQSDERRRLRRWLFALLHSWDWLPLLLHRPLWDLLMVLLSLGGVLVSATAVVIGYRRVIKFSSAQRHRRPVDPPQRPA